MAEAHRLDAYDELNNKQIIIKTMLHMDYSTTHSLMPIASIIK